MKEYFFQNGRKCPQVKRSILLIDDDEDDQSIFLGIADKLHSALSCITAWNGKEALDILDSRNPGPELIFLDLNMPLMNGHQFLNEIRKETRYQQIPVIVLTTSSHAQSREKAMNLGAWHFIAKPNQVSAWEEELKPILTCGPHAVNGETSHQQWAR